MNIQRSKEAYFLWVHKKARCIFWEFLTHKEKNLPANTFIGPFIEFCRPKAHVAGGSSKPLRTATNKVWSTLFWNTTPIWTQNGPWKRNLSMAFWKIAILRFLFNETRPKLTNFRDEITKGSTFESGLM